MKTIKNPKKTIILISFVFAAIILFLAIFATAPLLREIEKETKEFTAVKKDFLLAQQKMKKFEEIKNLYFSLEPDVTKAQELLVDSDTPLAIIEFWEKTAKDSNVLIEILPASSKAPENDFWNSIFFRVTAVSSFTNFLKFFQKIETGPFLIEIQNIVARRLIEQEISQEKYQSVADAEINVAITFKVYVR